MTKKKVREIKSLLIPTIAIAMVLIGLPYITFGTYPIYTMIYLYFGVMSFLILIRSKDNWFFETNETFDKVLTIIMWGISIPTFIFLTLYSFCFLTLAYITSLIFFRKKIFMKAVYSTAYIASTVIIFIFGINLKVHGQPTIEQCILTPNHCSDWDDPLNPHFAKNPWKVIYAPEIKRIPLVKAFLNFFGVPLSRKEMRSRKEVSKAMLIAVEAGFNIVIYPEGRRLIVEEKKEDQKILLPFEPGAFNLSKKTGKPIQPVVISWTFLFKPRSGQWWVSPRKIKIFYLEPQYCGANETAEEFAIRVHGIMEAFLRTSIED